MAKFLKFTSRLMDRKAPTKMASPRQSNGGMTHEAFDTAGVKFIRSIGSMKLQELMD